MPNASAPIEWPDFNPHLERWSPREKSIARKLFDRALQAEVAEIMQVARTLASNMSEPADLWELEEFLRNARRDIDRKYDYRYSVLPFVFGRLLREGRINEADLDGLSESKAKSIRSLRRL